MWTSQELDLDRAITNCINNLVKYSHIPANALRFPICPTVVLEYIFFLFVTSCENDLFVALTSSYNR